MVLGLFDHVGNVGGDEHDQLVQIILVLHYASQLIEENEYASAHGHFIYSVFLDELEFLLLIGKSGN